MTSPRDNVLGLTLGVEVILSSFDSALRVLSIITYISVADSLVRVKVIVLPFDIIFSPCLINGSL